MATLENLEKKIDEKVGWNRFMWIIGGLLAICTFVVVMLNERHTTFEADIRSNRDEIIDLKSIVPVLNERTESIKESIGELKILIQQ